MPSCSHTTGWDVGYIFVFSIPSQFPTAFLWRNNNICLTFVRDDLLWKINEWNVSATGASLPALTHFCINVSNVKTAWFFFPCKNVQLKLPFNRIPFRRASFPAVVEFNFHGVTGRATAYVQNSEPCFHALEYLGYISQKWLLKRNIMSCSHFRQDKRMRRSYFWKVMVTAWHCKAGTKSPLEQKRPTLSKNAV